MEALQGVSPGYSEATPDGRRPISDSVLRTLGLGPWTECKAGRATRGTIVAYGRRANVTLPAGGVSALKKIGGTFTDVHTDGGGELLCGAGANFKALLALSSPQPTGAIIAGPGGVRKLIAAVPLLHRPREP